MRRRAHPGHITTNSRYISSGTSAGWNPHRWKTGETGTKWNSRHRRGERGRWAWAGSPGPVRASHLGCHDNRRCHPQQSWTDTNCNTTPRARPTPGSRPMTRATSHRRHLGPAGIPPPGFDYVASMAYTFQQSDSDRSSGRTRRVAVRIALKDRPREPGEPTTWVARRPVAG
jgi:hypothetical protein